jgi:hypothetical protein
MQAQQENAAFYIYQNDGHFDGFFYDEVEKIRYSVLDTLGIEHDEVVSQEIVTADSTYRIMLSAIDSVGFVQPEIKYNPKLRRVDEQRYGITWYEYDSYFHVYVPSWMYVTEEELPHVGDVFADFDIEEGWAGKVVSITKVFSDEYQTEYNVKCEPITDITDIFEQFVSVEEYGYRPNGELARRRVAARPDLNVGEFPRTTGEGTWEGDIFNFSIAGHIPLYVDDQLSVTIDPSLEGKLNVKAAWNMSWLGDKYISITSTLNFGVGVGFTVDGTIDTYFPGGIGGLNSGIPVPASCPLFMLDISPDAFLRGDAHVKFNAKSPMLNGAMWARLEINNWWPSMNIGFGKPKGEEPKAADDSGSEASLELSGFVQGGLWFPMKYRSLPILKSIFQSEIGGSWFVGPKLAGSIALDLSGLPWEDTSRYNLLKNTKLSLHMLDADFEVKGTVKTAFSGKKEVTLADGSLNLFPPLDAAFVPEFEDCVEYTETRMIKTDEGNKWLPCHIFAFKPGGIVLMPVDISVYNSYTWKNYYHIHQMMGQDVPKNMWAELVIPYNPGNTMPSESREGEKIFPLVKFFGNAIWAEPSYKVWHGARLETDCDTLMVSHDFRPVTPITLTGNCDQIISIQQLQSLLGNSSSDRNGFYKWLKVSNKEITVDTELARQHNEYGASMNYSPSDTLKMTVNPNYWWNSPLVYYGLATVEGELFYTRRHNITVWVMPNRGENPNELYVGGTKYDEIQSTLNGNAWTCSATKEWESNNYIPDYVPVSFNGKITEISHKRTTSMTFGKEANVPWHFDGGSDVFITNIKYEAQDSEGNYLRDSKGEIIERSVTVTERTTWNSYDTGNNGISGGYHLFGLGFTPPGQRTVTAVWSTGTTETHTYDKVPDISVYWREKSEEQQ